MSSRIVLSILGIALVVAGLMVLYPWTSTAPPEEHLAAQREGHAADPSDAVPQYASHSVIVAPFEESDVRSIPIRLLDIVSGSAIEGASLYADAEGKYPISKTESDGDGRGILSVPRTTNLPAQVFVRVPGTQGGSILPTVLPAHEDPVLMIPLLARIVVTTSLPSRPSSDVDTPALGALWCVSWPTIEEAVENVSKEQRSRLATERMLQKVNASGAADRFPVEYHEVLRRTPGCDKSKLICIRRDVAPGAQEIFDVAAEGEFLLSYYIPSKYSSRRSVMVRRGEIHQILLPAVEQRDLKILVLDEKGAPVPNAHCVAVLRRPLAEGVPRPDGSFCIFTPEGSQERIAVHRLYMTADVHGEVTMPVFGNGPGEIYLSVAREGFVASGRELWSGDGLPEVETFTIVMNSSPRQSVTLRKGTEALVNLRNIAITDLEPTSLFGQIDFPGVSSDSEGTIGFEQLTVGHRYSIRIPTEKYGTLGREFIFGPMESIDF
ncbi:MAG TPA: hypothetical protein PKA37_12845 [Planctomycetota bacterium]|nr:hypothetical protein [Planctomycetota bacterium]